MHCLSKGHKQPFLINVCSLGNIATYPKKTIPVTLMFSVFPKKNKLSVYKNTTTKTQLQ